MSRRPADRWVLLFAALGVLLFGGLVWWLAGAGPAIDGASAGPIAEEEGGADATELAREQRPVVPTRGRTTGSIQSRPVTEEDALPPGGRTSDDGRWSSPIEDPAPAFRRTTHRSVGEDVVLEVSVIAPGQIAGPRLPAWLEMRGGTAGPGAPFERRILGDIHGDRWRFEVGDLRPGPVRLGVRTGVAAPIADRVTLEVGRNAVEYVLADMPQVRVEVHDEFPWATDAPKEAAGGAEESDAADATAGAAFPAELSGDRRQETTAFGPSTPWLVVPAEDPDDTVLIPMVAWGDVIHARRSHEGPFVSSHPLHGFPERPFEFERSGGWPWSRDVAIERDVSNAVVAVTCVEREPEPLRLSVKARFPEFLWTTDVTLTLYGDVPQDLAGPDDGEGPRMWRRTAVALPVADESMPTGGVTLDPRRIPRGGRAMFSAPGMRPLFFDVDELFNEGTVLLEFEPGDGGVLLFAYQNHRAPRSHWAPGFGFDALRAPTSDEAQLATVGFFDDWSVPQRSSPMGWIEHVSFATDTFAAERWQVHGGERNLARSARVIHPELAITVRDAAPGVIEVFVQD